MLRRQHPASATLPQERLKPESCPLPLKVVVPHPFVFPNLVLFELSATPSADFSTSQLLDFLEASQMLQTVHIKIIARILPGGTPEGGIVILPNVKEF